MKEIFYLNKGALPAIPVPHDCIIDEIQLDDRTLIFIFENDISYHDSIKAYKPDAKSLIIRFHLSEEIYNISNIDLYIEKEPNRLLRLLHKPDTYKAIDPAKTNGKLIDLSNGSLAFFSHYVGDCSMIVKLWSWSQNVIFDMRIDYVEFEWIC